MRSRRDKRQGKSLYERSKKCEVDKTKVKEKVWGKWLVEGLQAMRFRAGSRRTCWQKSWHSEFHKEKASQSEAKEVLLKDPKNAKLIRKKSRKKSIEKMHKCEFDYKKSRKRRIEKMQKCESSLVKSQGKSLLKRCKNAKFIRKKSRKKVY